MGLNENQHDSNGLPTLSVCICVDERNVDVRRVIESVKEIASEIILIESIDNSSKTGPKSDVPALIDIAKEYGAGYYCKEFGDDLSQYMNAAAQIAGGDFVLIIDPDEELEPDSNDKIKKLLTAKHIDVFHIKVINYDTNGDVVSFYYRPKMFRPGAGFSYSGEFIPRLSHNNKEKYTNITIKHYGYTLEKDKLAIKNFINLKLFKKQIERDRDNPYCYYYAAEGCELVSDFDVAREYLAKAVKIIERIEKQTPELKALLVETHFALARIAYSTHNFDESLKYGLAGYEVAKSSININFILGEAYFALKDYENAHKHLSAYLELREMLDQVELKSPFMIFDAAYYVNFMAGKTLMALGRTDEAYNYFQQSLSIKPNYPSTLNELGCMYQINEDYDNAKEFFEKAYKADPNLAEAVCNLGVVTFIDEPEKGLELIEKASKIQPDNQHIKDILENYSANKDKIIEKRRVSVCIYPTDHAMIKETAKSLLDIADEFIILDGGADISEDDVKGKRVVKAEFDEKMDISSKKGLLLQRAGLDWVLFINEGESVNDADVEALIELTKDKAVDMYYLNVSFSKDAPKNSIAMNRYESRLFRRNADAKFDDTVFDHVTHPGKSAFSDVTIVKAGTYNPDNPYFMLDLRAYNDELSKSPKNYYARFMLGKLFSISKENEKAMAEFELAKPCIDAASDDVIGYPYESTYLLGCMYLGIKKPIKARDTFESIIKKDDNFFDAYFQLGGLSCVNNNEDAKKGAGYLEKYFSAVKSLSKNKKRALISYHTLDLKFKAYYYHGLLCQKAEEYDKAKESFDKAIKANPKFIHSYISMASISLGNDDFKGAKDYLNKAIGIDGKNYTAHYQLAVISAKEKKFDEAKELLNKCIEIKGDNIESLSLLGRIHEETKNFEKAEQCYRAIVDKQPQDKNAILKLGDILLKKDDSQGALRVFKDLLAMQPSFVPANVSVGSVLIKIDDLDGAEAHFNALMNKYSEVAEYVLYASKVAVLKKNFGDALEYFDKLVLLNPKLESYVAEQKKQLKEKGII